MLYFSVKLPGEGGFLYGGRCELPIYEYQCDKGHRFERAEGFDAPSERRCESCGGRSRRVISLPVVIFKGSGFYSTDNRKSSSMSGGSDGGSSTTSTSSGDGASPDGGSESKAEPAKAD